MSHVATPLSFSQVPFAKRDEATRRHHRKLATISVLGCLAVFAFKIFVVLNLSM